MRVLVTGGTGVVGEAAVRALVARGHAVRLLSRHANRDARAWPGGVEAHEGDVTRAETLAGACDGCDAVLHLVAVVDEAGPELTFERVNVRGTEQMLAAAERAGVPRFVYVSSLGAEAGKSPYHRSKFAGERATRGFSRSWLVVRPGNVYGPGDGQISLLLRMVRTLPAIPVLAGGDQEFQPIWADDLGAALAAACERDDLAGEVLEVAGPERTSMNDLLDRFERLTGRSPSRVPVPGALASLGLRAADALGVDLPINEGQLTMLTEGNVVGGAADVLERVLGVTPTPLDAGLRRLLDALPEQLPSAGVGALHRKRFWADVAGSRAAPEALFSHLCARFQELSPDSVNLASEPGAPTAVLERGETVTMALPMRGNVQVRVAELTPTSMTLQTVEGHPLAGAVRLTVTPAAGRDGALRFEIETLDRAASAIDWLAMATVGGRIQDATWRELVERVVTECGGEAPNGVEEARDDLTGEEAARVERWLEGLAMSRKRRDNASP